MISCADGDNMILQRGITGFWSENTEPPPFLDEKVFYRMCHALAQKNGGVVTEVDTDTPQGTIIPLNSASMTSPSYFAEHPFTLHSFCTAGRLRRIYSDQPAGVAPAPGSLVRFLGPSELNRDWHGLCGGAEPGRTGADPLLESADGGGIVFNTWD